MICVAGIAPCRGLRTCDVFTRCRCGNEAGCSWWGRGGRGPRTRVMRAPSAGFWRQSVCPFVVGVCQRSVRLAVGPGTEVRMSSVTEDRSQSATEQVMEHVQDAAERAKDQTRTKLRAQIDSRSSQAGEQVSTAAGAMRKASEQLRVEGNERVAKLVDGVADRGQRLGDYLTRADGDQILRDVEDLARKQPWLFVGGSAVVGFLGSRFMKASSSSRYQGWTPSSSAPQRVGGSSSAGYISPAGSATAQIPAGSVSGGVSGGGSGGLD
jgi:ElaB/YqjD/DUF883 family membrane-anchored ribosome-binding protein